MPKLGLRLQSVMPQGGGVAPDPANWFRTSLHNNDFDTTLTAALTSEHADDYVLVIDTVNLGMTGGGKTLFPSYETVATAEIRMESPGSISTWNNAPLNIAGPVNGERILRLNLDYSIPTVSIVPNNGTEIVGTVRIEGTGETKQEFTEIICAWQVQYLHLTHLDTLYVYAHGDLAGSAGDNGASGSSVYGNNGSAGADAVDSSFPAGNGTAGESVSTSNSGASGSAGANGNSRAVEQIYLNGCIINSLFAYNSPGSAGGVGGDAGYAYGGNGGAGGNGSTEYPDGGDGGNGGDAAVSGVGGSGGSGGNAYSHSCYTHGQGAHSTVTYYYKTGTGGLGGVGGSAGSAYPGSGGAGGNPAPGGLSGISGTSGTSTNTSTAGSNGANGSSSVRLLSDNQNKITFLNQY